MSIGNAILNQALSRAQGELKKVVGNLPGSALGGNKSAFGGSTTEGQSINLQYPLNVENETQQGHYIMFFINKIDPASIEKWKDYDQKVKEYNELLNDDEWDGALDKPKAPPGGTSTLASAPKGALAVRRPGTVRLKQAISLYMPPSVKTTYTSTYSDTEIGAGAQAAASLVQSAIESGKKGALMKDMTTMSNWKSGAQTLGEAGLVTAFNWAKGIESIGGPLLGLQGTIAAAQIASGKVMSDKMELLFTGVGRRKFSYTFTFIPKSEKESEMVANIVHTFKKHMTPEFGSISIAGKNFTGGGRVLKIPETFDIQYMYHSKENPWLNKISTCYLTSMDVQYGSDKAGFYEPLAHPQLKGKVGPVPTHTTISLNFEEIEKMSRTRIDQGF